MRTFDTGATRDNDNEKLDYEGFLSPFALKRYAIYLDSHRTQADGKLRDSDNWQKGIPVDVYMKSMFRHFLDVWTLHRDGMVIYDRVVTSKQEALCAVIFNAMGYLHELEKYDATAPGRVSSPVGLSHEEAFGRSCRAEEDDKWVPPHSDCQDCTEQGEILCRKCVEREENIS